MLSLRQPLKGMTLFSKFTEPLFPGLDIVLGKRDLIRKYRKLNKYLQQKNYPKQSSTWSNQEGGLPQHKDPTLGPHVVCWDMQWPMTAEWIHSHCDCQPSGLSVGRGTPIISSFYSVSISVGSPNSALPCSMVSDDNRIWGVDKFLVQYKFWRISKAIIWQIKDNLSPLNHFFY